MSMIKVTYSSDISNTVGVGGEIVKSASDLSKQAATIFKCEYEALKPPSGMTGIHLVALGDAEAYPMNRNGDLFPKEACVKYVDTFVKHGHVYEHHRNKDPRKALGQIKAAAYNPDMHRIELYIWADNEKSHDHLERLEKTGEVSFSMACHVPFDRCSYCNAIRERPGDPNECEHVKYSLGKIAEDGRQIGTYNDKPVWFDISFVGRPADRIAWNLKVASDMHDELHVYDSVKQAEVEGYTLPDDLAIKSDSANRKRSIMKKLADSYDKLNEWLFGDAKPTGRDVYTFELRKLAGATLDDESISRLRELNTTEAFSALGDAGIVMDAKSFMKYAFGPDYSKVEKYAEHISKFVPGIICEAVKSASCAEFCNNSQYDAPAENILSKPVPYDLKINLLKSAAARGFGTDDVVSSVIDVVAGGNVPVFSNSIEKVADGEISAVASKLAKRYAMYKIAAICAILDRASNIGINEDNVIAVAAAQDLKD